MNTSVVWGLILGLVIGGAFAWLQLQALRRNELLEKRQELPTLLKQIPGSGARVAFLLVALVLVQVLVPAANKWWLTGGLAAGYGVPFLWRLFAIAHHRN